MRRLSVEIDAIGIRIVDNLGEPHADDYMLYREEYAKDFLAKPKKFDSQFVCAYLKFLRRIAGRPSHRGLQASAQRFVAEA